MHPPPTQTEGAVMKAEQQRLPRFAVLIDADNTSPQIAGGLFEEVAKFGEASVRRIYGDFSSGQLKSWADILQEHAIDPYQQFAYTKGKNASDIALVIDAMDLLHSGRFDGFCLVSSDSDFTRLASRLREEGADVYGFGAQKTPESFRQACRRFVYIENLLPDAEVAIPEEGSSRSRQPASAAIPILTKAIGQMETEDGWVGLGVVGQRLANIASDFDPRTYGFRKLSDLVRQTGAFEMDQPEGRAVRIRAKPAQPHRGRPVQTAAPRRASVPQFGQDGPCAAAQALPGSAPPGLPADPSRTRRFDGPGRSACESHRCAGRSRRQCSPGVVPPRPSPPSRPPSPFARSPWSGWESRHWPTGGPSRILLRGSPPRHPATGSRYRRTAGTPGGSSPASSGRRSRRHRRLLRADGTPGG